MQKTRKFSTIQVTVKLVIWEWEKKLFLGLMRVRYQIIHLYLERFALCVQYINEVRQKPILGKDDNELLVLEYVIENPLMSQEVERETTE